MLNRPDHRVPALLGLCLVALVVAALLTRGGTAVDEAQVGTAGASDQAEPGEPDSAPAPPRSGSPQSGSPQSGSPQSGALDVRADGVAGLRLGTGAAELVASGWLVQAEAVAGCRRVRPGPTASGAGLGPGDGVAGWLVDDHVAAVTVSAGAGESSSFLGPGVGGRLDDLPTGGGLRRSTVPVPVPWRPEPVPVAVAQVSLDPGVEVSFVDLDDDGSIDVVQVRQEAAAGCVAAEEAQQEAQVAALPPLTLTGRGQLQVGVPLVRAVEVASLADGPADGTPPPCRLVLGEDEPGLLYVVVAPDASGQEVVRAVTVDAGTLTSGPAVGDTAEEVASAYPGLTSAYLADRWGQGLSAGWQVEGGELRLWPRREEVRLAPLDAALVGPRDVVGLVQVGPGC